MSNVTKVLECRACKGSLSQILSLGDQYVIDFPKSDEPDGLKAPLELMLCGSCGLVQLQHTVDQNRLFDNFWYQSSISKSMIRDLHDVGFESRRRVRDLENNDVVVDIGSNDGTLLKDYPDKVHKIGFEPATNVAMKSTGGYTIINDFFSSKAYWSIASRKAKIVTAIAMFYDLQDPNTFLDEVVDILDDEGVFVIQQNYLPTMMLNVGFDNIVHEHLEYYSYLALDNLLRRHDLEIFDAEINPVNGGSLRTYISHRDTRFKRNTANEIHKAELGMNLNQLGVYERFEKRVENVRDGLRNILDGLKHVYVLGAGTRGNTILQYAGIDHAMVEGAVDKNPEKWGRETVGGRIPIMERSKAKPDHFLLLPVHFLSEFMEQEKDFLANGGDFLIPLPEPRFWH